MRSAPLEQGELVLQRQTSFFCHGSVLSRSLERPQVERTEDDPQLSPAATRDQRATWFIKLESVVTLVVTSGVEFSQTIAVLSFIVCTPRNRKQ